MGIFDFFKKKSGVDASVEDGDAKVNDKTKKLNGQGDEKGYDDSPELLHDKDVQHGASAGVNETFQEPILEQPTPAVGEKNVVEGITVKDSDSADMDEQEQHADNANEHVVGSGHNVVSSEESPAASEDEQNAYLGNLEHTAIIDQLLRVPREERNDDWVGNFLSHVGTASFACGEPQVIQGPDNFPYFQIFVPEANKPFQCYVLEHMLDDFLLENGFGVALEPKGGEVEWVLSYGDLLHYSVHRTFAIPQDHPFGKASEGDETIQSDEEMLVGAPSEFVLPPLARNVIKSFLQAQGVQDPKVCIIDRAQTGKGQDLVFNIVPWQFESQAHYRAIMQALGWFLPRYYSYIGAEEPAFEGHFASL
ncbi:hypothetical protein [Sphingobacterium paludis]|uniref:Uncharacterized protein n=1 Tax=Sphingobacterium paludis TaxID=1476465 RepID=A0A4R7CYG4_9SPHI|nr:hypothetical protein [Sphingobacterium paludis]TDS12164.1 hypothetical protein B0I21_10619 [Sphingobacterium paludis]